MTDLHYINDAVASLKGIGSKKREQLSHMGIETVGDLLGYYPVKYKDRRNIIAALSASEGKDSLVSGKLIKLQTRPLKSGRSLLECSFKDESCYFYAVFFNMPYLRNSLSIGKRYIIFGKMSLRNGSRVWTNPEMSLEGGERDIRGIIPVYRKSAGITDVSLRKWVQYALETTYLGYEWIDTDIVSKRKLCDIRFAYNNIHFPASEQHYKAAKYRLNYEAMLMYQLAVRISRRRNESNDVDSSVGEVSAEEFINNLSFELTGDQRKCIDEIYGDLSEKRPMNRLVQGDVGCGKTVVAEAAIYRCAKAGMQSAMMAPTEILARQHFERLSEDLSPFGIKCALLVSAMKSTEKREIIDAAARGSIDVLVGTHALIQNDVIFSNLALVITDEQHRFGVDQRKALMNKGRAANVCVMSATPIPRTLANTVFGDMDFSIIRSMPSDRKKIITRALDRAGRERAYIAVRDELEKGRRAYIIAPSIDSEEDDLLSVNSLFEEIRERYPDYKAALLHGRLGSDEKEAIMRDFSEGRVQILVSTIVIEVGIDVAEASIIVIENSERFGLAQMHQLRGRVGRSDIQSYCYIINYSNSVAAKERAKAMAEISDGFEISEMDYELRGPGDIMGTMQSGNINANILALSRNTELLQAAIEDAEYIMNNDNRTDKNYAYERIMNASKSDNSKVI
ncbi:MAG: ATP-dependent DNA helicase RecG [Mogibacterium sp.]|nr:ATP-dependent DNA helicase RecG [Mogibacterium sp.]